MDWGMLGCLVGLFAGQTTVLLWMMSKLDSDIKQVSSEIKAVNADSNAKWMAINSRTDITIAAFNERMDGMAARIDKTQEIIMKILEKKDK